MSNQYSEIIKNNLETFYQNLPEDPEKSLSADASGKDFFFKAFGKSCCISPSGIFLNEQIQSGAQGILISLYALHANPAPMILKPFAAYREFPDTMPYVAAFATHTEQVLVSGVPLIKSCRKTILEMLEGCKAPGTMPGDFSMILFPLPKIALCYIFYEADDDFDAGVTCLFSNNASQFMPADGLADVGEYTSKTILEIIAPEA